MKMRKHKAGHTGVAALATLGVALVMGGCSLFNTSGSMEKEAVLPTDRETLHQIQSQKVYTSAELAKGIIKGDWTIEEVDGENAVGEKIPYLRFEPSEKRIYGNNGCNVINASYTCNPADSTMRFDNLASTMMTCGQEGITDLQINRALADSRKYSWELDGHDYRITLYDGAGKPLLKMVHCNFEYLNGMWHIVGIEGEPVDVQGMNILIDVDEGKLHGNTGCNIMNGKIETDLDTPNSISFSAINTTRMACPDMELETRLVVALEEASSARALGPDTVELLGSNKQPVVKMVRIETNDWAD